MPAPIWLVRNGRWLATVPIDEVRSCPFRKERSRLRRRLLRDRFPHGAILVESHSFGKPASRSRRSVPRSRIATRPWCGLAHGARGPKEGNRRRNRRQLKVPEEKKRQLKATECTSWHQQATDDKIMHRQARRQPKTERKKRQEKATEGNKNRRQQKGTKIDPECETTLNDAGATSVVISERKQPRLMR